MFNPHDAYRRHQDTGATRIELLLALYDGAISRLETARDALARRDPSAAAPALLRAQRIVLELLAGLDLRYGEVPRNLQRLYTFVLHSIAAGSADRIAAGLGVLGTLREGLLEIRTEAVTLERSGAIPPADAGRAVQLLG